MIRIPDPESEFSINVKLKTGETFTNKDIPTRFMEEGSRVLCFWEGDALRCYPLEDVEYFVLIPSAPAE